MNSSLDGEVVVLLAGLCAGGAEDGDAGADLGHDVEAVHELREDTEEPPGLARERDLAVDALVL